MLKLDSFMWCGHCVPDHRSIPVFLLFCCPLLPLFALSV